MTARSAVNGLCCLGPLLVKLLAAKGAWDEVPCRVEGLSGDLAAEARGLAPYEAAGESVQLLLADLVVSAAVGHGSCPLRVVARAGLLLPLMLDAMLMQLLCVPL